MSEIVFPKGGVLVRVAALVYGKDPCWVRAGLISGWHQNYGHPSDGLEVWSHQLLHLTETLV